MDGGDDLEAATMGRRKMSAPMKMGGRGKSGDTLTVTTLPLEKSK
jgi:hypothetical protein